MTPATMLSFDGITQPVTEWALDYGIAPAVIIARLERGLSVEQAITTPMVTARGQKLKGEHLDSYIVSQRRTWRRERRAVGKRKRKNRTGPGVVSNFETLRGTGAGSFPQEIPEITFSGKAENA